MCAANMNDENKKQIEMKSNYQMMRGSAMTNAFAQHHRKTEAAKRTTTRVNRESNLFSLCLKQFKNASGNMISG